LVIHRGTLVYEQYFVGEDQCFAESLGSIEFCSDTKHDLRSITKSVTSLLVGIATDRKLIKGVARRSSTIFQSMRISARRKGMVFFYAIC
jgi:hypothetical protein